MQLIDRSPSCCQLIGLDLTLSSDGHIWFIETNNYIGLRRFGWMMDFNYNLVVSNAKIYVALFAIIQSVLFFYAVRHV